MSQFLQNSHMVADAFCREQPDKTKFLIQAPFTLWKWDRDMTWQYIAQEWSFRLKSSISQHFQCSQMLGKGTQDSFVTYSQSKHSSLFKPSVWHGRGVGMWPSAAYCARAKLGVGKWHVPGLSEQSVSHRDMSLEVNQNTVWHIQSVKSQLPIQALSII